MKKDYIIFKYKGRISRIKCADIVYIEQRDRISTVYTCEYSFSAYRRLAELESFFPATFYKCHRSLLINMDRIITIKYPYIMMDGNHKIALCKQNYLSTRKKFLEMYEK